MGRSGISMKLECWYFNLINYLKDNILNGLIVSSITGIVGCAIKKHKDKKQQQKIFYEQLNNTIKSIMDNTLETLFSGKNFLDIEEIIYELNQKVGTLFDSDIEADMHSLFSLYQTFLNQPYGIYGYKLRNVLHNFNSPDSLGNWQLYYEMVQQLQEQLQVIYYKNLEPKLKKTISKG
mgnify:CR=1 FL=1|jgi:hypothetical protein